jgi:hypothetical protein
MAEMNTLIAMAAVAAASVSAAPAAGPARVSCSQKSFPNIQGQNAFSLARQADGGYTARYEAYGPAKTQKGLKCTFDVDPLVFHCETASASWGIFGRKLDERSIDGSGKAIDEHVYKVEAVKAPQGEPRTEKEFRFPLDACKAER